MSLTGKNKEDDSALELGPMRHSESEPGAASESNRSQLLSHADAHHKHELSAKATAVAPILSYCVASITMTVVNKYTVSGAHFTMNLFVLLCQCLVGVSIVYICKLIGVVRVRDITVRDIKAWFPISTMLVFVIWTGSKALQFLPISIYTIFKNLTIILIAYGEVFWFGGKVTQLVFYSFVLMVLSSIIAAWPDVGPHIGILLNKRDTGLGVYVPSTGSGVAPANVQSMLPSLGTSGYFWMFVNCLVSATYVLVMRKRIKGMGFKDWDTMFYNNLLSIPVLAVMSLLFESWTQESWERNFPTERRTNLVLAIALSGTGAIMISYTTAWCIRVTSSTTYSMVGALNKLPLALSGMLFFGDPITVFSTSAIGIGFGAGVLYAYGKNKEAEANKLANSAATGVGARSAGSSHTSDPKGDEYSIARLIEIILSLRSSANSRMYALVELEHYMAERIFAHEAARKRGARDACLDWTVMLNGVPILPHIRVLHVLLQQSTADNVTLASELGCALSLLQGMCLTHYPSKSVCSTRQALELFLAVVSAPYANIQDDSPLQLLPSHALDTLMCTLVDASPNTCGVFEHANGLSIIRGVMKQCSTKEEGKEETNVTAAKCFEFLLFYLQAQSFEDQAESLAEPNKSTNISLQPPTTPSAVRQSSEPYAGPTPKRRDYRSGRVGGHAAHRENPFTTRAAATDTPAPHRNTSNSMRRTISPHKDRKYKLRPAAHERREDERW
ncbi:GDP-mannose transporter into the lumen of the Golgi [Malassezia cuniculi]|uniref:GDP-mannose transporter n=1 Tax=Malassezia cuniculi TaxID=948313 RepID=A0AAF0J671_9BASI|nr:GDP-mannose transporter into the lumen of the Golgi [Malassezia cuniculi]